MDLRALVESTSDPAFASDEGGRLMGWNAAAERLLGHPAESVLGRPCHSVVCGTDLSGNVYCRKDCALREMIRREEPIHSFEFKVRHAAGEYLPVACSVLTLSETRPGPDFSVLHLLQPASRWNEDGHLPEWIRRKAAGRGAASSPDVATGSCKAATSLTRREIEVLRLVAQGLATNKLAEALSVSVNTVRSHSRNIQRKLKVHNKLQAVSLARRYDLI